MGAKFCFKTFAFLWQCAQQYHWKLVRSDGVGKPNKVYQIKNATDENSLLCVVVTGLKVCEC